VKIASAPAGEQIFRKRIHMILDWSQKSANSEHSTLYRDKVFFAQNEISDGVKFKFT
jgi:hypothetical protein